MLRVMRLKRSDMPQQWDDAANGLGSLIDSLGLPAEAKTLIATRDVDGEYVNFYSPHEGSLENVPIYQGKPLFPKNRAQAQANYNDRRDLILKHLEPILAQEEAAGAASKGSKAKKGATGSAAAAGANSGALGDTEEKPSSARLLYTLLKYPQHVIILNETMPVIIPSLDAQHVAEALAAQSTTVVSESKSHGGCIAALLLLLLLALGAGYYFWKIWPWPFDGLGSEPSAQEQLSDSLAQDEQNLKEIEDLIEKTDLRLELAEELNKADELSKLQQQLDADEANLKEIDSLIAQVEDRLSEADKLAQEEQAKAAEEAAHNATEKAAKQTQVADKNVATAKKLPKCSIVKQQGKIPQLVIATDGSGSMLNSLGNTTRIDAAIRAATELVDNVDTNVPIRLFGIQGCPLARDYGVFSGGNRAQLKRAIKQTDPRLVRGMLPIEVLTPLVSSLRGMANSVPKDVDSVGILISDGYDTCDGTEDLDICMVAREIHASRPKLKINVILIGDEIDDAKCIASITGGKLYRPSNSKALTNDLKNAGSTLVKVCE